MVCLFGFVITLHEPWRLRANESVVMVDKWEGLRQEAEVAYFKIPPRMAETN
jgi:hypothetical protein